MTAQKPAPIIGRLAIQLKLITQQQPALALRDLPPGGERRLGAILLESGFINERQLEKLQAVQRDLVAKHRAKMAAALDQGRRVKSPAAVPAAPSATETPTAAPAAPLAAETRTAAPPAAAETPTAAPVAPAVAESQVAAQTEVAVESAPALKPAMEPGSVVGPDKEVGQPAARAPEATHAIDPEPTPVAPPAAAQVAAPTVAVVEADAGLDLQLGEPSDAHRERLLQLLGDAVQSMASDIHIHAGATLKQRVNGALVEMSPTPISVEGAGRMVASALDADQRAADAVLGLAKQ